MEEVVVVATGPKLGLLGARPLPPCAHVLQRIKRHNAAPGGIVHKPPGLCRNVSKGKGGGGVRCVVTEAETEQGSAREINIKRWIRR